MCGSFRFMVDSFGLIYGSFARIYDSGGCTVIDGGETAAPKPEIEREIALKGLKFRP
jgi:hypothetical protein